MTTITQNIQGTRSRFVEEKPIVKALREETLNVSFNELVEVMHEGEDYCMAINPNTFHFIL